MTIQKKDYSVIDNKTLSIYELRNNNGTTVKITNVGSTITSIQTADKEGNIKEITLGFDTPEEYLSDTYINNCPYLGTTAGRFANRIANGCFTLNNTTYQLAKNNGNNHLHGGPKGFHLKIWDGEIIENNNTQSLVMSLLSPHMDEGFPGNLKASVKYTLTDANELIMEYYAESDMDTPVNLTNHAYFNLSGEKGNILEHEVMIMADNFTPKIDGIPTGEIKSVKDTPFDFTEFHTLGERINELDEDAYDHNFVLNLEQDILSRAAIAKEENSGRVLEVFTTMPGMQLYSGYYLDGSHKRGTRKFESFEGFCMETQYFPDAPNKENFPNCIVTPQNPFKHTTVYKFSIDK